MSILRFRRVELADWLLLTDKDRNTRYTVVNEDGSIYGEYIGDKLIGIRPIDFEPRIGDLELETARLDAEVIRVEQKANTHIEDLNNPHRVDSGQVGSYNKQEMNNKLEKLEIDGGFL